jgi:hypothetical protein
MSGNGGHVATSFRASLEPFHTIALVSAGSPPGPTSLPQLRATSDSTDEPATALTSEGQAVVAVSLAGWNQALSVRRMRGACHIAIPVKARSGKTMKRTASRALSTRSLIA